MDILNDSRSRYYNPKARVSDIEVMMHCSHRTAERLMQELKRALGIDKYKHPTMDDLKRYFGKTD